MDCGINFAVLIYGIYDEGVDYADRRVWKDRKDN